MTIPGSVSSLGSSVFQNCSSLTKVTILDGVEKIENSMFSGCTGLTSISLPTSLTNIGDSAFSKCQSLVFIDLPAGVTEVGYSAFNYCTSLSAINLSANLSKIGGFSFTGCTSLKEVNLPAGVTTIPYEAFSGCTDLENVTLSHWTESIDEKAFYNCSNLKSIVIPQGATNIGKNAFAGCSSLTSVDISDSVTNIGEGAFSGCSKLQKVSLPTGLTKIAVRSFSGCRTLTDISIPDGVTEIGHSAFENCAALESVEIPEGVKQISSSTFYGNKSLKTIYFPLFLTYIESSAFTGAASKIDVYYAGIESEWQKITNYANDKFVLHYNYGYADSMAFREDEFTLGVGSKTQLYLITSPEGAKQRDVTWESSNPKVATVDQTGMVTAIKTGNVTIFADAENGLKDRCEIIVTDVAMEKMALSQETLKLDTGDSFNLSVVTTPANATMPAVEWNSSNEDVVTVDNEGTLAAVSCGTADITATTIDGAFSAVCSVQVFNRIEHISTDIESLSLEVGNCISIPEVHYDPAENINVREIIWTSSDESLLKVGEDNTISAVGEGSAELTVTANGVSATIPAEVHFPVELTNLVKEQLNMYVGETESACIVDYSGATVNPENEIVWSSADESVATVNKNGLVYGVSKGEVVLTARTKDGREAKCRVKSRIRPLDVTLSSNEKGMLLGESVIIQPSAIPITADLDEGEWSSSNPKVASVDQDGKVTGLSEGTAFIIFDVSGIQKVCKVDVCKEWIYNVTFNAGGGTGSMEPMNGLRGNEIYLVTANTFSNGKLKFSKWQYINRQGSIQYIYDGEPISDLGEPGETVELRATWYQPEIPGINVKPTSGSTVRGQSGATAYVYADETGDSMSDTWYAISQYSLKKGGSVVKSGSYTNSETAPRSVSVGKLEAGTYTLTWKSCSAYRVWSGYMSTSGRYIYDYYWDTSSVNQYTKTIIVSDPAIEAPEKVTITNSTVDGVENIYYLKNGEIKIPVTVKSGDITLVEGRDYSVTYSNISEPGEGTIIITGKGNYYGKITKHFWVAENESTKISLFNEQTEVSGLDVKAYNGKAQTLSNIKVKIGSTVLKQGTDYSVSYKNNTNAGNARVLITGKGLFKDTLEPVFVIEPTSITKATVTGIGNKVYTGSAIKPVPSLKIGTVTLKNNTDYSVSYKNNTNVGTASVTITGKGNYKGTVTKQFSILPISVISVKLNKAAQTITAGKTATLTATVSPANATNKKVTWKSSNTTVATVSAKGVVTAKKTGTAKITATAADGSKKSAVCTITVKPSTIAVTGVKLDKTKLTMGNGQSITLKATVSPSNATNKKVTWKSSNTKIAMVSSTGKVTTTSAANGTVKITATTTDGKKVATCTITVRKPSVSYRTHVQTFGWQDYVKDGEMSGTSGKAKRLEGINIKLSNLPYSGSVVYRTHVQTYGWQTWRKDDEMSGTSGEAKRLEGIQIYLTGELAKHYDVYYRVHAQTYGWLDYAKNGVMAGTSGLAKRLEGINIVLVPKGGKVPGSTKRAYVVGTGGKLPDNPYKG